MNMSLVGGGLYGEVQVEQVLTCLGSIYSKVQVEQV